MSKFLRMKQLSEKVALSNSTISRLETRGVFPKRKKIAPNVVCWDESEVDEWMKLFAVTGNAHDNLKIKGGLS